MLRIVFSVVLLGIIGLMAGSCGSQRFDPGGTADSASTPTVEPIPTYTPTTVSVSVPTETPVLETTPSVTENNAESDAVEPNDSGDASSSTVLTTESSDGATSLLPTTTPASSILTPSPVEDVGSPQLNVVSGSVNVRRGPGTEYEAIDVVGEGDTFPLTGRNEAGDWWQVCCFDDQHGWLYGPLVDVQNAEIITLAADIPPTPESTPTSITVVEQQSPSEPPPQEPASAPDAPTPEAVAGTAGSFDPDAQYQIVHYRLLGFDDNNGGIFNKGGQQIIFVTVLDQNGNGVDGAIVKDAVGDKLNVSVGSKGPGKAEIKMDWDPYKLYVAADPSGAVTSQISNQMNNPYPHIPDVVGMLGPVDNEYAICPTVDDRCDTPFYHAHWSYEITFQKVK